MERRIVEDNDTARIDLFKKPVSEPELKQDTIGRSAILHGRHPLTLAESRNDVGALELLTADMGDNFLPARSIGVFPV